jgi:replicative DNA helicase
MFADVQLQTIARAIYKRLQTKEDVNPAIISAAVPGLDVWGLLSDVDAAGLEENTDFIYMEYTRRREIEIMTEAARRLAAMDEVKSVQGWVAEQRAALYREKDRHDKKILAIAETLYTAQQAKEKQGFTGIHTGYNDENDLTGGHQRGDLIILAARPSMGKTTLAVCKAVRAAKAGCPALFITIEVSAESIYTKANAFFSGVDTSAMRSGRGTEGDYQNFAVAADKLIDLPFWVEDGNGLNLEQVAALVWEYKRKHGVEIVYLDYLQLMTTNKERGKNREQEISELSRGLKGLARAVKIPFVVLSQLSRSVETRGGTKRPMLSDLRESGAIEQDADMVAFIYRPDYYGIKEDENGNSLKGITEVIVSKHRNGALKTLYRKFEWPFTDFLECYSDGGEVQTNYNPTIVRGNYDEDLPF